MSDTLTQFDGWLTGADGLAALVIREHLMPVEGYDAAVFPPTFAAGGDFLGGYNIDVFPDEKTIGHAAAERLKKDAQSKPLIDLFPDSPNVCLMDSVGSQANRIEPTFAEDEYAALIPQIVVEAGEKQINLLDAGHRAGDALVRCSELQDELHEAFRAVQMGDAEPLAKIAPTSLVFGAWDSRDTQAKLPRLVSSAIRAFNVRRLTRGAVYIPPVDYSKLDVFSETEKAKAEGSSKSPLAQRGFVHNPASGSHGGVIADGGIRRDATLSLAALHLLQAADADRTLELRRYVLGLALVALTAKTPTYLRQGCNLVLDPDKPREYHEVYRDGRREPAKVSHDDALAFAKAAAEAFGPGESRTVAFDKKKAKEDVKKKD